MKYLPNITLPVVLCLALSSTVFSQQAARRANPGWSAAKQAPDHNARVSLLCGSSSCPNFLVRMERSDWNAALRAVPQEGSARGASLSLPMPDGYAQEFEVFETATLSPQMAAKYPDIRTYRGSAVNDASTTLRMDMTAAGMHAMVLKNGRNILIDPYDRGDSQTLLSYEPNAGTPLRCAFGEVFNPARPFDNLAISRAVTPPDYKFPVPLSQLQVYRTALMLSASYVAQYDGTEAGAVAAATSQMNRVNGIYERDLNIRLQITGTVVFLTAASQPFSADDETNSGKILDFSQRVLTDKLGVANYDVGEGFTGVGGGGVAALGSACDDSSKGSGSSLGVGTVTPIHWVNLVAHEFGHQFGANHTFNASGVAGCRTTSISPGTAFEPGSGSTTMSYVGLCSDDTSTQDLQPTEDLVFHAYSIKEMLDFANGAAKPSRSCTVPPRGSATNTPPKVTVAAANYTIPAKTPFYLDATGSDADAQDAANLTYSWEQVDVGKASPTNEDEGTRPLFRSYLPVTAGRRFFPSIQFVLAGTNNPPDLYKASANSGGEGASEAKSYRVGEVLPTTDRVMRFRVSVRDNRKSDGVTAGSIGFADVNVRSVATAGPFQVTAPNGGETLTGGTAAKITWNVAGTDSSPIATPAVRITLSTDSGKTFTTVLGDNIPNTGSASLLLPAGISSKATRVRIDAVNNIYFDVSDADFSVTPGDATAPLITSVVNTASFAPTLAPNTLFSVFGNNLGTSQTAAGTTVGGATVSVCGTSATLSFNNGALINGLIPALSGQTQCPVVVTAGGKTSAAFIITLQPQQALGIFQFVSGSSQLPVATHADYSVIGPASVGLKPAQNGETIILWCTGWNTGAANPDIAIGGKPASVAYYGPSGGIGGLCQINVVVPLGLTPGPDNMVVGSLAPLTLWIR